MRRANHENGSAAGLGGPRQIHTVRGGNGVRLHVREWGQPDAPPILLIHGWSQGLACWRHQVEGELAAECRLVALDIRGHGMSERPRAADAYQDADLWAMDIAAVLDQLNLHRPILVGWSYGGFIISDYLRAFGQDTIAAINYVGAAALLNERFDHIGPGFLDNPADAFAQDLRSTPRLSAACYAPAPWSQWTQTTGTPPFART